jgi:hypothetical protein
MRSNIDCIRLFVFRIWFLTLAAILLIFAEKLSGLRHLSPPFGAVLQSFQMMIGLVVPQIGMMAAFYLTLERQKDKLQSLSAEQVSVITWLSIAYHLLFIVIVVFGIGFYGFDSQADGQALQRNSAAVVSIMGLFSVFLAPVAFLFARPRPNEHGSRKRWPAEAVSRCLRRLALHLKCKLLRSSEAVGGG